MQTTTLEQIHSDPAILDRAIESGEPLEIVAHGKLQATVNPAKRRDWRRPMGPLPDFAQRRAELRKLGMRRLLPEEEAEFCRLIRSDREI